MPPPSLKDLDSENERALASFRKAPSLADLDALNAEALRREAPAPAGGVEMVSADGRIRRRFSEAEAPIALSQGFVPAEEFDAEQREAKLQEEYGGIGGQLMTGAQELLDKGSLGISGAASAALTASLADDYEGPKLTPEARSAALARGQKLEPERSSFDLAYEGARGFQRDLREANPATAAAAGIVGAAAPALVTGGAGLLARAPAGVLARGAMALGEGAAARLGGGAAARIAGGALAGTAEGTIVSATQAIADQLPKFATDPMEAGEHVLSAALEGGLLGGVLGGGLVMGGEVAGAAVRGAKSLVNRTVATETGGGLLSKEAMQQFAYDSATKAAIGRTNIAAIREAEQFGGTSAIGKSLLEEGVVAAGDNVQAIAQKAGAAQEKWGLEIGRLVSGLDQVGMVPDTRFISQRIYTEVVDPLLASPSSRARGEALLKQFSPLLEELDKGADGIFQTYQSIWNERRVLDGEVRSAFRSQSPIAEGIRDVRATLESGFKQLADQAGGEGWSQAYQAAKTKYSHMRFAAEQADEAINSQLSNRWFSPSDYGMALGGGAAGGPIAGIAMGVANKVARERGRATVAATLHQLASGAERQTAFASIANSGMERLNSYAQTLVQNVSRSRWGAVGSAVDSLTPEVFHEAIAQAQELSNPQSPASQELAQTAMQLDQVNPGMGRAYFNSTRAASQLIASKLPKITNPAVFAPKPVLDPLTERSLRRTVQATQSPRRLFERMAAGTSSQEDVEVARKAFPAQYKRFQQAVTEHIKRFKQPPSLETRLRLSYLTGIGIDASMTPDTLRFAQQVAAMPDQQKAEEAKADAKNQADAASMGNPFNPSKTKFRDADAVFAPRADALLDRR